MDLASERNLEAGGLGRGRKATKRQVRLLSLPPHLPQLCVSSLSVTLCISLPCMSGLHVFSSCFSCKANSQRRELFVEAATATERSRTVLRVLRVQGTRTVGEVKRGVEQQTDILRCYLRADTERKGEGGQRGGKSNSAGGNRRSGLRVLLT